MSKDTILKNYLNDQIRIADLINGTFFNGKREILPEDISEKNTELISTSADASKEHDLLFKAIRGANCFIFALENQTYIDPSMVLRALNYTVEQYMKQRKEIMKNHFRDKTLTGDEYLSRFSFQDFLKPVLLLVIYWDTKEWKGARTLHELLDWTNIPDIWKPYFADYEMKIIEISKIQHLEYFHSDLKLLLGFLQNSGNKENLLNFVEEHREHFSNLPPELFQCMTTLSNTNVFKQILPSQIESSDEGGTINMCKALDELVKDCMKEGYDNGFHLGYDSGYDSGYDCGKDQGIITGTQEGVDKVNQLNLLLIKDNRINDLMRAANDTEYQNELFLQYAIS